MSELTTTLFKSYTDDRGMILLTLYEDGVYTLWYHGKIVWTSTPPKAANSEISELRGMIKALQTELVDVNKRILSLELEGSDKIEDLSRRLNELEDDAAHKRMVDQKT